MVNASFTVGYTRVTIEIFSHCSESMLRVEAAP